MTYDYIIIEPRAIREEDDADTYRAGVIRERALALAAPTLVKQIEELLRAKL
jgi:hypothetical protein